MCCSQWVVDQTLERILGPNLSCIVALAVQAPSETILLAGVDVLLILAERWYSKRVWDSMAKRWDLAQVCHSIDNSDTLYLQFRGDVYRTIQESLQTNVPCEFAVSFVRILMTKMKGLLPPESSDHA
jgi:hypothetical protein